MSTPWNRRCDNIVGITFGILTKIKHSDIFDVPSSVVWMLWLHGWGNFRSSKLVVQEKYTLLYCSFKNQEKQLLPWYYMQQTVERWYSLMTMIWHVLPMTRWWLGSSNIFLLSTEINLFSVCLDTPTAKYSRSSSLLHEVHQQPKQALWSFYSLGIILNICFYLCQDLLTLQTVPFHYLHVVPPLQVNLNTSCQLCWSHSRETTTLWSNCPFRRFDRGT